MFDEIDSQVPARRRDKPKFLTQIRFEGFDLPPEVLRGLEDTGFTFCTPIQAQVLPLSLTGRDVAGQAQTGTGKTAAFLVTVFSKLLTLPPRKDGLASALIVAPTRELALQIFEEAELIGRHTGLKLAQVLGGIGYRKQAVRPGPRLGLARPLWLRSGPKRSGSSVLRACAGRSGSRSVERPGVRRPARKSVRPAPYVGQNPVHRPG